MACPPRRRRTILAFGESRTDTSALRELAAALRSDLPAVAPRKEPIILSKGAATTRMATLARRVASLVRAEQVEADVVAVLAHRDLDAIDSRETMSEILADARALQTSLAAEVPAGVVIIPIVPAWEMEAWWLLWPAQVAAYRPGWRLLPDRSGKRVDQIPAAKETLIHALRPTGRARVPDYSESDGPRIAAKVREARTARAPRESLIKFRSTRHRNVR